MAREPHRENAEEFETAQAQESNCDVQKQVQRTYESALKTAREEAEVWIRKAQEDLAKQIEAAKQELQSALQSLASGIAETVLGESSSAGRERGVGP